MAEITAFAYDQLTTFIQNNFKFVALTHDGTGQGATGEIIRLDPSDTRVQWNSALTDDIQEIQIKVAGADADIAYPQTFTGISIYLDDTSTDAIGSELYESFTISADTDEFTAKGRFVFTNI